MTEKAAVTTIDTSMMDGAALAFIGDAVYEIYVRKHVLAEAGSTTANKLAAFSGI